MGPFLSGGRPNSGHGVPFGRDCSQIANYETIRRLRYREILVYENASGVVGRRPTRSPKRRRRDSSGPDHGVARDMPSLVRHAGIVDVGYHRIERQFDADTLELPQVQPRWVKPCQIRGAPSIESSRTAPAITPVAIALAIARTRKSSHSSASSCSGLSSSHVAYVAQR